MGYGLGLGDTTVADYLLAANGGNGLFAGLGSGQLMYGAGNLGKGLGTLVGGAIGGLGAGALLGAKLGMIGGGVGMAIGAVAGGAIGMGLGSLADSAPTAVKDVAGFRYVQAGLRDKAFEAIAATSFEVTDTRNGVALADDADFQALIASAKRGTMAGGAETEHFLNQARTIAARYNFGGGISGDQGMAVVAAAVKAAGVDIQLPETYTAGGGLSGGMLTAALNSVGDGAFWNNVSGEGGTIMSSAAGTSAIIDAARGMTAYGKEGQVVRARQRLRNLGMSGSDIDTLMTNLRSSDQLGAIAASKGDFDTSVGKARLNRSLRASIGMLRGMGAEFGASEAEFASYNADPSRLISEMAGGISADTTIGRTLQAAFGDDVLGVSSAVRSSSTKDIVRKYFGGNEAFSSAVEQLRAGTSNDESFRRGLSAMILDQSSRDALDPVGAERKNAEALTNAATILERLVRELDKDGK
jgi:hypothetical protein